MSSHWQDLIGSAQNSIQNIDQVISELQQYKDSATAEIARNLRVQDSGIELDLDAIHSTLTRPYTLLPINEHEAWLIHWRGVRMPIFGWVVAQEAAFIKAKVTRSMDLLTPLPGWMKQELGWKPPEHGAVIDGTRTTLKVTKGTVESFKRKYGKYLGSSQVDEIKIKGGDAWIRLVAALVKDGILPYAPKPVAAENWDNNVKLPDMLWDIIEKKQHQAGAPYITRAVSEFMAKGAVLINYPPGSGKTLTTCVILNHFRGRVLLLADTTMLIEQWKDRLQLFCPDANVTVSTYQGGAKYLNEEWDLVVFDESQRVPANTFSKLAFVKTKYRIGLTGTAWREDDRQHLIVALSGFPVAIRWSEMIASGVLKRPRIIVATVANETAKTAYVKQLVSKRKGRCLIFCDWIEQGQQLADALDVPFVHGTTPRKLQLIEENDVCVVSRIGDRGISLPDLRLVMDEICEIAVVDLAGEVLINTLVRPTKLIPTSTSAIHGITDDLVKDAPTFGDLLPRLEGILRNREVLVYNAEFDEGKLGRSAQANGCEFKLESYPAWWWWFEGEPGFSKSYWHDAMDLYATFYGEWSEYHHTYRWQRLSTAARQCGIELPAGMLAHRALADAEMTRRIVLHMAEQKPIQTTMFE